MRVELTDPSHYPDLRDYFLRLGASAVRREGATLDVHFADGVLQEDESPEMYFRTWARYRGVEAQAAAPGASSPPNESREGSSESSVTRMKSPLSLGGTKPLLRLGELLLSKALINADQLSRGLIESRETGEALGRVLIRHGSVFESELARVLAEQWSIPYVNLASIGVDRSALTLLPREVGLRYAAVPVRFVGDELRVAFADPSDTEAVAAVQERLSAPIQPAIAEFSDIDAIWRSVAA
jgi:class 3 adenylate cyclase